MTIRKTEIIEWSTTPRELRFIANHLENIAETGGFKSAEITSWFDSSANMKLRVRFSESKWLQEQAEDKK